MSLIYSMTGFASVQGSTPEGLAFTLSVKSVNHRFLDLHFRLPVHSEALEAQMRRLLKEHLRRGHLEITLEFGRAEHLSARVDQSLLAAYLTAFRAAAGEHGLTGEPDLNALLRMPGIMTSAPLQRDLQSPEAISAVMDAFGRSIDRLKSTRAEEGQALAEELRRSMLCVAAWNKEVATLRGAVRDQLVDRLRARLRELAAEAAITEDRLLTEAALLAERSDIEEEGVRLRTHLERFIALLDAGGELGKRLDFLLQELNREVNTMLSKTGAAAGAGGIRITELGLEMKAEVERAREQVQNLE